MHRTPVVASRTLNAVSGAFVFLKCEIFQRTGSFKIRGAFNAISQLRIDQKARGVIAYSSGNHAQATALAGRLLGIPTLIVMPNDAPAVKLNATRAYGAEIVLYDKKTITREELAGRIAAEKRLTLIPPYDHPHIIAGQATAAMELFEDAGALDYLLVCCGGGGLLAGSALAAQVYASACKVIGIEPSRACDATRSFASGLLQRIHNPATIADGARTPYLGRHTFPIIMEYVHDMLTVSEEEIIETMRFLWERLKLVVEPTGALATAGLLAHRDRFAGSRVGAIISGGNVDLASTAQFFSGNDNRSRPPEHSERLNTSL